MCVCVCMTPDVAVHHPRGVSRSELPERRCNRHHPPALTASGQLPWRLRELHQNERGPTEEPATGVRGSVTVQRTYTGINTHTHRFNFDSNGSNVPSF